MNRVDRLMGLITLLQSKKQLDAAQIAAHFGVSERTIYRDLRAVGEIGIPVVFDPEKGYAITGGFFLPPVSLTLDEANALSLAEPLVVRFADLSVQRHFGSALQKIKMVLGRAQRESFERAQAQTAHFIPDHYAHLMPSTDYLAPLQQAISEGRVVRMTYENADNTTTERDVEPIGLTFYSLNWHLVGWCRLRQDYRDFRVSRIRSLRITIQSFDPASRLSLEAYLQKIRQDIVENGEHPLT